MSELLKNTDGFIKDCLDHSSQESQHIFYMLNLTQIPALFIGLCYTFPLLTTYNFNKVPCNFRSSVSVSKLRIYLSPKKYLILIKILSPLALAILLIISWKDLLYLHFFHIFYCKRHLYFHSWTLRKHRKINTFYLDPTDNSVNRIHSQVLICSSLPFLISIIIHLCHPRWESCLWEHIWSVALIRELYYLQPWFPYLFMLLILLIIISSNLPLKGFRLMRVVNFSAKGSNSWLAWLEQSLANSIRFLVGDAILSTD